MEIAPYYGHPSPFPPSFDGSPWSYAFGLFGNTLISALALTMLLAFVLESRRLRTIHRALDNYVVQPGIARWSPLWLYRTGMVLYLVFVLMRVLPNTIWMLAWGEVSKGTIEFLLTMDVLCNGLALFPFIGATICLGWGRQVIPQKLIEERHQAVSGGPAWRIARTYVKIMVVVSIISFLVTIGKASA